MVTFTDPVHMVGPVTVGAGGISLPTNTITADGQVQAGANIGGAKTVARMRRGYANESATTAVTETRVIHVSHATGILIGLKCGLIVANVGAATVTFDLKKNGSSILTGVVSFSSADAARAVKDGTLSVTTAVVGDIFEVTITATAGGGTLGKGAFASLLLDEYPT